MSTTHVSRRDAWIVAALVGGAVFTVVVVIGALPYASGPEAVVLLGAIGLSVALALWPLDTRYTFEDDALRIVSGPMRWRVPYAAMRSIARSGSWLSSPALSLVRLDLRFDRGRGERSILISPEREAAFLDTLRARAPRIAVDVPDPR